MLLRNEVLDRIIAGEISVVFRVWKKPTVKTGGTLKTRKGVIAIDAVERSDRSAVTDDDIMKAGLASREEICEIDREGDFYLIRVRYHGEDPRIALRTSLDAAELDDCLAKVSKMGEWAPAYLKMIAAQPNIHAQILADSVGLDKPTFKGRVRRLKALGLTESLRPGYRLSPRGEALLKKLEKRK